MTAIEIAVLVVLSVAGALALLELLFVLAWRFAPLHAPNFLEARMAHHPALRTRRHYVGRFLGFWLARAPLQSIRRRIRQLFRPELLGDARPQARWQVWYNAHIPAFVAASCSLRRSQAVLGAVMDGLTDAVKIYVEREREGPVAFDVFWPILECIEEMAAHLPSSAYDRFADKMLELCTATGDETIQAASAWLVNELCERSAAESNLARTLVRRLYPAVPRAARLALQILGKTNPLVRAEIAVVEKDFRRAVPKNDNVLVKYDKACEAASTLVRNFDCSDVTGFVEQLCDVETFGTQAMLGVAGVAWMDYRRRAFRELCQKSDVPIETIEDVCIAAMACAEERRTCAFLTIEALEPVRDSRTNQCVRAMCDFLRESGGTFDQGIAVCISEGLEEHEKPSVGFPRTASQWTASEESTLATAATELIIAANGIARAAPLSRWINLRLDLRELAARRRNL